jgi:hypothetical protein
VRRRRHEEEVPRQLGAAEQLAQVVALRRLQLGAEVVGGHLVRLVDNDEVPVGTVGLQLLLPVLLAGELVEARDHEVVLGERVAGLRRLDERLREDVEAEPELLGQLGLPLLDEAAGRDDQAALQVSAQHQFADEKPRHDGLAGTGVVGEDEAERLLGKHRLVHGADLVRQRIHVRGVDRHHRIEEVRELDARRLGRELEVPGGGGEGEARLEGRERDLRLVRAEEGLLEELPGRELVADVHRVGAGFVDHEHTDGDVRLDADDVGLGRDVFELHVALTG